MPGFLIATNAGPRLTEDDRGRVALGFARGLLARKHTVVILTFAAADTVARVAGLARRLRKVEATVGGQKRELALFEGRSSTSDPRLLVVEVPEDSPMDDSQGSLWLGAAARGLAQEGRLDADVAIGWGETSALALGELASATKFFILPDGRARSALSAEHADAWGLAAGDELALAAVGANAAHAVIAPSRAAAASLGSNPALANRASDEPIIALRFGSDEPPFDPGSDPALAAHYTVVAPGPKSECRAALAHRLSLACGAQTLLLSLPALRGDAGAAIVAALESDARPRLDVLALVPAQGDRGLVERARALSIEHPTRAAMLPALAPDAVDLGAAQRQVLAAADGVLLVDDDFTGREAGRALRYGAVPVLPAFAAAADEVVDLDVGSGTGHAVLYAAPDATALRAAIARLCVARQNPTAWATLVTGALASAPLWSQTAERLELFGAENVAPVQPPAVADVAPAAGV